MTRRILVAGVGNIFLGDDGFGVEVARRLAEEELPAWVTVADYGISGMHLAYDLGNSIAIVILVDAAPRGGAPGTVYVIEPQRQPDRGAPPAGAPPAGAPPAGAPPAATAPAGAARAGSQFASAALFDGHGMQPDLVLGAAEMLGAQVSQMLVVGCEPASTEYGIGLNAPVAAAVPEAVRMVLGLIAAAGERRVAGAGE
ncbi:MAG TPA: hydrogenase maturation protease [Streptosporangiaceae bacterium]|nr:hydrogenase maturation protease [Streptosporangiaceae bacterium]